MNPPISRPAFVELIADVGEHLAGNWEIIPNPEDWPMGAHLVDHDLHASLYFNHHNAPGHAHEGFIHVSTDLPKDAKGEVPYVEGYGQLGKRMPSINVSFKKTPQQIANSIERRLMPEYMDILVKAMSRIASSDSYHSKTEGFAGQIAKLVGVEANGNKVDFYRSMHPVLSETISRAEVHDDDVELELRLSYGMTMEVLEFLISHRPLRE
jgi:hypothetical protein